MVESNFAEYVMRNLRMELNGKGSSGPSLFYRLMVGPAFDESTTQ